MTRRNLPLLLCSLSIVLILGGCASREHLSEDYGRKSREFFERQHVYADAEEGSPAGLDSEEAAAVGSTYQKNLVPEGAAKPDASSRVLVLENANGNNPQANQ